MEQLNYHKLINLKKRINRGFNLNNPDCEYSKKIMAVINETLLPVVDECIISAKAVSKERDEERRGAYNFEEVTCDVCGKEYQRGYIYKHKRDRHGAVSKPKKETDVVGILQKCLSENKEK
jgi:hypothetical protein